MLRVELTSRKLGVVLWGQRLDFESIYELISECWCDDFDDSQRANNSCRGVLSSFAYDLRHTFMGNRFVKLDGKNVKKWDSKMFQLFEDEVERFEVGVSFSWPNILYIMASWWECVKQDQSPAELKPLMVNIEKEIYSLLQQVAGRSFKYLEPYLQGAIYVRNPCLMIAMENSIYEYLCWDMVHKPTIGNLCSAMEVSSYKSSSYNRMMTSLECTAKKNKCDIADLSFKWPTSIENVQL